MQAGRQSSVRTGWRWAAADLALRGIERFLPVVPAGDGGVPLFVVGAPRSGTTLVYQLITHGLRTSYFCNLANRHPLHAAAATWLMRSRIRRYVTDFRSTYGATVGCGGPSQGDHIWQTWLGSARRYCDPATLEDTAIQDARSTVAAVVQLLGAPFVNKSIANSVRIAALLRLFPRSLFVVVERDLAAAGRSQLLNLLRRGDATGADWVSAQPRAFDRLRNLPPPERAVGQIVEIRADIRADLGRIPRRRVIVVRYEDVCASPAGLTGAVARLWHDNGVNVRPRRPAPAAFPVSMGKPLEPGLESALLGAVHAAQVGVDRPGPVDRRVPLEIP